jgi:two-component system cell cycle sensor histidine kinase/response regulator CckA
MDAIRLVRQQTTREGERRFESMIQHSSDLILVVDAGLKVKFASPAAEVILGRRPELLLDRRLEELLQPEDAGRLAGVLHEIMLNPGSGTQTLNARFLHHNGSERKLECQITNLMAEPAVHGVVLNARDLTERLLLEERLRQSQKMDVVGQLAGGVAHDFNNLLTAVLGGSELALADLPEGHPVRRDVEGIKVAAMRGAALTKRLLAFSRTNASGVEPINVKARVESIHILLQRMLGEAQTLAVKIEDDPGIITVDPESFEHSLLNLVANARDAVEEKGGVTLSVARRVLSAPLDSQYLSAPPGDYVWVEVADTGMGMTPQTLERIFQPFFTTKVPGRGTGLGLAGIYSFMREFDGGITVHSEPGVGTRIGLWFPRTDSSLLAVAAVPPATNPPRGGGRILLVEDEAVVRVTAGRILQLKGFTVFEAENPAQARQLFQQEQGRFDLVISDVIMPGESGPALVLWMRELQPGLRVLLISGYPGEELTRLGLQPGGIELLRKPFTIEELSRCITRIMAGGK